MAVMTMPHVITKFTIIAAVESQEITRSWILQSLKKGFQRFLDLWCGRDIVWLSSGMKVVVANMKVLSINGFVVAGCNQTEVNERIYLLDGCCLVLRGICWGMQALVCKLALQALSFLRLKVTDGSRMNCGNLPVLNGDNGCAYSGKGLS